MTSVAKDLADRIAAAATELRIAVAHNDSAEVINWSATVQLLTAELVTKVVMDVRNI